MTRGERNNNPLNIRRVAGTHWRGEAAVQDDPAFVQFEDITWGVRAALKLLRTYRDKYAATSIKEIISTQIVEPIKTKKVMTQQTKNTWAVIINAILTTITAILSAFGLA